MFEIYCLKCNPLHLDLKNEDGTYKDRVESMHPDKILLTYQRNLQSMEIEWGYGFVHWLEDWKKASIFNSLFIYVTLVILGAARICVYKE